MPQTSTLGLVLVAMAMTFDLSGLGTAIAGTVTTLSYTSTTGGTASGTAGVTTTSATTASVTTVMVSSQNATTMLASNTSNTSDSTTIGQAAVTVAPVSAQNTTSSTSRNSTDSTSGSPVTCSLCGLGNCSTTANGSSMANCTSNSGVCYGMVNSTGQLVALSCNSVVSSSSTTCQQQYTANAADTRCEFCCSGSLCNSRYGSSNIVARCIEQLQQLRSGAGGILTAVTRHRIMWTNAAVLAVIVTVALLGSGGHC